MEANFEKNIRDKMSNPPELPFEERLWEDLSSRLKKEKQQKNAAGFFGSWPLLLAIFTTGLALLFYAKHYKAMKKVSQLEQQIQAWEENLTSNTTEKHVTVIYDTIYNLVEVGGQLVGRSEEHTSANYSRREFAVAKASFFSPPIMNIDQMKSGHAAIPASSSPLAAFDFPQLVLLNYNQHLRKSQRQLNIQAPNKPLYTRSTLLQPLPTLPTRTLTLEVIAPAANFPLMEVAARKQRKKLSYYLQKMKPTRFSLSGMMGTFTSLNLGSSGFNLRGSAYADLHMGDHFVFTLGAEYFSNDFNRRIEEDEPGTPKGFPDLPSSNQEDLLTNIKGDFNYLQIPFGFKYLINPIRHFYPYVGFGIVASKSTRSRLEYEYTSLQGATHFVSQNSLLPNAFDLNGIWTSLGFQLRLNKNWYFLVEGSSQFDLDKGKYRYEDLELLKFSGGFKYTFE